MVSTDTLATAQSIIWWVQGRAGTSAAAAAAAEAEAGQGDPGQRHTDNSNRVWKDWEHMT